MYILQKKQKNDRTARCYMGRSRVPESAVALQIASSRAKVIFLSLDQIVDPALPLFHIQDLPLAADHREIFLDTPLNFKFCADRRIMGIWLLKSHCYRICPRHVHCDQKRHIWRS